MSVAEQVKEGLGRVETNLAAMIEANKQAQNAELDKLREISEKQGKLLEDTQGWIKNVEAQVDRARFSKEGSRDGLIEAIPAEHRFHIDRAVRAGVEDPVLKTAHALWWKYQYEATRAMKWESKYSPNEWRKLAHDLEAGMGFDPALKTALGEDTATMGGNVIATPVEAMLMRLIADNGLMRPLVTKITMTSKVHQIPNETTAVTAYIVAEAGTITDAYGSTTTIFGQEPLTAKKFTGLATISNELLEDNIIGLQDYLFTSIAEKIARLEDQEAIDGTGTNFTGLVAVAGLTTFTASSTGATSGGVAASYDNLVALAFACKEGATRENSWYIMHPYAFRHVVGLVDTSGQPIFQYANVPGAVRNTILGYPVGLSSVISLAQTTYTSSTNIYFGPPSKIIFGDRTGMTFDIDPFSQFATVQTRVRVVKRTGIAIPVGEYFACMIGVKNAL